MVSSLQYADYRLLWLASLSAASASWALIVARGWLVYTLSGSSFWVGLVTFAAMGPMFLAPPIAGFLADKFDRRKLLRTIFAIQLVQAVILAVLAVVGTIDIWHLVVLSFVNGLARASQMPTAQALLPNLVPRETLFNAISLNVATTQGSRLVGPALIAPLLAVFGPPGAFIACVAFYILSLILASNIRTVSRGSMDQNQSPIQNFLAGAKFVYRHALILPLVVTVFLHCCLTMSFESLLPVFSEALFYDGGAGTTYLMSFVGIGAIFSVLTISGIQDPTLRGRLMFATALISGLSPLVLGFAPTYITALIGCALMGGSQAGYMVIAGAIVQMSSPDAIRGRVMSVYLWHVGGMMAVANLAGASLSDYVGAGPVIVIAGAAYFLVVCLSLFNRPLRTLYTTGQSGTNFLS